MVSLPLHGRFSFTIVNEKRPEPYMQNRRHAMETSSLRCYDRCQNLYLRSELEVSKGHGYYQRLNTEGSHDFSYLLLN